MSLVSCFLCLLVKARSLPSSKLPSLCPLMHSPKRLLTPPPVRSAFYFSTNKNVIINTQNSAVTKEAKPPLFTI